MTPSGLRRLPKINLEGHYADDIAPGWFYRKQRRSWSNRGQVRGMSGSQYSPLTWWEAVQHGKVRFEAERLTDVVAVVRAEVQERLNGGTAK